MTNRLYLGDAFGWQNDLIAKVSISQLRESGHFCSGCPEAQLIKNRSLRWLPNIVKVLGYIPGIHVLAGAVAIYYTEGEGSQYRPNHKQMWICRGIAMIITGPLLAIVDLVKFIFDCTIAIKYNREHKTLLEQFNTSHKHSPAFWPGHPIDCLQEDLNSKD